MARNVLISSIFRVNLKLIDADNRFLRFLVAGHAIGFPKGGHSQITVVGLPKTVKQYG